MMMKKLLVAAAMTVSFLCLSDRAQAQFGGLQVQVGGYGSGVQVGGLGYGVPYGNSYSTGFGGYGNSYSTGFGGYGNSYAIPYGGYYSNGYGGSGYEFGRPSVFYGNSLSSSTFGYRSYPSMNYRVAAPRYYAAPVRRYGSRYR